MLPGIRRRGTHAPKGPKQTSPGQSGAATPRSVALGVILVLPFQGCGEYLIIITQGGGTFAALTWPCPGLDCFAPAGQILEGIDSFEVRLIYKADTKCEECGSQIRLRSFRPPRCPDCGPRQAAEAKRKWFGCLVLLPLAICSMVIFGFLGVLIARALAHVVNDPDIDAPRISCSFRRAILGCHCTCAVLSK